MVEKNFRQPPLRCLMMRVVEHLLNLLWLCVAGGLFAAAIASGRRGLLRCSLPVALGAMALLALVLFPALSMTDDMQRAKMDTESSGRYLADGFLLGSTEHVAVADVAMLPFLPSLSLPSSRFLTAEFLSRLGDDARTASRGFSRVVAARPPPAL